MRTVALSDKKIQKTINEKFIPLKIVMTYPPKMKEFPLDWPAMRSWRIAYKITSGQGFTGCSVVSPDLRMEYGSTGSAMVWEMFESTAYDAKKFQAMLDQAAKYAKKEREIRGRKYGAIKQGLLLTQFRNEIRKSNREGMRLPPKGFSAAKAIELFKMAEESSKEESSKTP